MAAHGKPMQGNISPPEELLYYKAQELYSLSKRKMITAEIGAQRKSAIIADFISQKNAIEIYKRGNIQTARLFQGIELAAEKYAHERTIENANGLYKAVYGLLPKGAVTHEAEINT